MSLRPHDLWGKASPFPLSAFFLSINDTTFEIKTRFYLWSTATLCDLVSRFFSCGWTHFWTLFWWSLAAVGLNPGHWIQGSTSLQLEDCPEWATLFKPPPRLLNPRLCCDQAVLVVSRPVWLPGRTVCLHCICAWLTSETLMQGKVSLHTRRNRVPSVQLVLHLPFLLNNTSCFKIEKP